MIKKLTILSFAFILLSNTNLAFGQNESAPEINVVYGKEHIFTIETPSNWINDKAYAEKIGLECFFYPESDKSKSSKNYFYANGIDKDSPNETLENFIKGDLETYGEKYPKFTFEKFPIEITGGLRNGVLYSFSNLSDRFKEEVLYAETDDSFIIFSFSAKTNEEYEKYLTVFDEFIASFNYRGNNPEPFLEYMKNK
jgi:hypothetical protein